MDEETYNLITLLVDKFIKAENVTDPDEAAAVFKDCFQEVAGVLGWSWHSRIETWIWTKTLHYNEPLRLTKGEGIPT